jgi:hypothetical protein
MPSLKGMNVEALMSFVVKGPISILKSETWDPGRSHVLSCHRCGSALYLAGAKRPEHQKFRRPR